MYMQAPVAHHKLLLYVIWVQYIPQTYVDSRSVQIVASIHETHLNFCIETQKV